MNIRKYTDQDYEALKDLYVDSPLYGGQFDEARDGRERLQSRIEADPNAILVAEVENDIVGSVSYIEDGRVAMLFRFAVKRIVEEQQVAKALYEKAVGILKEKGHSQVLVYTPVGNEELYGRYDFLGMSKGNDYTCYWTDIS